MASGNLLTANDQELKGVKRATRDRAERNKNPFCPPIFDAGKSDFVFFFLPEYASCRLHVHILFLSSTWALRAGTRPFRELETFFDGPLRHEGKETTNAREEEETCEGPGTAGAESEEGVGDAPALRLGGTGTCARSARR